MGHMPTYDAEDYREATSATYRELTGRPGAVAERLAGRLTWALGTEHRYADVYESLNRR